MKSGTAFGFGGYLLLALALILMVGGRLSAQAPAPRSLDGTWEISLDDRQTWRSIEVPGTVEDQTEIDFDGISIYRRRMEPVVAPEGLEPFLRFEAVATAAEVRINGQRVGQHLGGWTPFECSLALVEPADEPWTVEVICDERVGHNTQGFLPVFAPHFSGIWKSVSLIYRPPLSVLEDGLGVAWDFDRESLQLEIPWARMPDELTGLEFEIRIRRSGDPDWHSLGTHQQTVGELRRDLRQHSQQPVSVLEVPYPAAAQQRTGMPLEAWSPQQPVRYDVQVRYRQTGGPWQATQTTTGFRKIEAIGKTLRLNGEPLIVRGLLNWGYAPPSNGPTVDEAAMRAELELARERGFNLMKFCLWIPPRRYLELCDEMGMLAWIEYPTWHPDFSPRKLTELQVEYDEFFEYDRNHPCVVLRSLTCETGPSADLDVIRQLYRQCKQRVPGAIVEDDSSWIAWNRVHDFYDDHPYGNNHTWVATLDRLKQHIAAGEEKPLVLGEAIAADTWTAPGELLNLVGPARPFWLPNFLEANDQWRQQMTQLHGAGLLATLQADSLHYANLMRKYQVEAFRREVPQGGYVISVVRDIPFCGMGLIDYLGREKEPPAAWNWHQETMLGLVTADDRRSFVAGQKLSAQLSLLSATPFPDDTLLEWTLSMDEETLVQGRGLGRSLTIEAPLPAAQQPRARQLQLHAKASWNGRVFAQNQWSLWMVPQAAKAPLPGVAFTSADIQAPLNARVAAETDDDARVLVTHSVGSRELAHLEAGRSIVLLANNQPGSFPLKSHWFLRGGPVVNVQPFEETVPHQMLVELQHFDLAGDIVPNLQHWLPVIEPMLLLWDNHDLQTINTHGVLFAIRLENGAAIFVSAAHSRETPAARFLLERLVATALSDAGEMPEPDRGLPLSVLREALDAETVRLDQDPWWFQPDPEHQGQKLGWNLPEFDASSWARIRTDRHWEGQGYDTLDGWAWYRREIPCPNHWRDKVYLNFTGVDDHYRLYINGQLAGEGGDIENRITAFEDRTSHDITQWVEPGKPIQISVEVYDWYGAGGIFRPVSLSTRPLSDRPPLLK